MNTTLQGFVILLLGLLGGLLSQVLLGSSSAADPLPALESRVQAADADLAKQLQSLQVAVDSLNRQLELQSSTLMHLQDQMAGVAELERSLRSGQLPEGVPMPLAMENMPTGMGFDAAVDAVIQQREQQQQAERAERREEMRKEQLARRVEELAEQLGLAPEQKDAFAQALDQASKERSAFFAEMRETGFLGRDAISEKMIAIREQEMDQLRPVLSEEQLSQYEELTTFRGFGGGGSGGSATSRPEFGATGGRFGGRPRSGDR